MFYHYPAVPDLQNGCFLRCLKSKTGLRTVLPLLLVLLLAPGFLPAQVSFSNFEAARQVIGQPGFTSMQVGAGNAQTPAATAVALSSAGAMAVSSQQPGRVLIWLTRPQGNGQPADVVIGKPDFTATTYTGPTAASMYECGGVAFSPDGKKLLVSDGLNHRVLIWNSIPTTNGQPADVVIGQVNLTANIAGTTASKLYYPAGILVTPAGKLLINDVLNHRVLVFHTIPTAHGAAADVILGQPGINTNGAGNAANQMNQPWHSALAPDGRLLISDSKNNRILVYNTIPAQSGASANGVIGQPGFNVSPASGTAKDKLNFPMGLTVSQAGQLAIADYLNHRVLLYDSIPEVNGAGAGVVLGQPGFTTSTEFNGGISAKSMGSPTGVQYDFNGRLFVSGRQGQGPNQSGRVLVFGNPVGKQADLGISSTASMALMCQDITLQYQVRILNNGPNLATDVVSTLILPAEFTHAAPIASAGSFASETGSWTLPTLNPGQSATLTFTGTVAANYSGRLIRQNAIVRSAAQVDPYLNNNASGTELTVLASRPVAPLATSVTICSGSDTTLTATGPGTLRWFNAAANGTPLATGASLETGILTGTTTYYVEAYNACISSVRTPVTVTVNQAIANNTIAGTQTVCQNQGLNTLTGTVPAGGNGNYQYQWQVSADQVNWQDLFNTSPTDTRGRQKDLNPGGLPATSYFRRRVIAGPCTYSYSNVITVTINPLPAVSFTGLPSKVCSDMGPITLTGFPAGGTFSGQGMTGNIFNPAAAGPGAYTITYTYTNGNLCRNSHSVFLLVGPAVYAGGSQAVCISDGAIALSNGLPVGGTWSGPGVTGGNSFDPAVAGLGDHVLTYTVSGNFGCGTDPQTIAATKTMQVKPLPVINPGPALATCIGAPDFLIGGHSPVNGFWSGPGVNQQGLFSPRIAGPGTHTLTYAYNSNGCVTSATRTVTVAPPPTVTLVPIDRQCSNNFTPIALTGGFPAGGTYSGPGVHNNRFTPSAAGLGTHVLTYTYTDPSGCTASITQPVMVDICTGVAEQEILKTLTFYPNPAQSQLHVAFRMPAPGPLAVRLLNSTGQVVASRQQPRQAGLYGHTFAVHALARGVYILQIITDQAVVGQRVILN
jgi:hypothetical protein